VAEYEDGTGPEIVFGLVGAVGTDLALVCESLQGALDDFAYSSEIIRLSDLLKELDWGLELPDRPLDEHIASHMDAGDELRETWARGDALALIALSDIQDRRERRTGNPETPAPRCAYILRSLKHHEKSIDFGTSTVDDSF